MTKNELIAHLIEIDGNPDVILASDEEGNDFYDLLEVVLNDDDDLSVVINNGGPVIVLWP